MPRIQRTDMGRQAAKSIDADRWHFVIPLRPSACLLRDVSWLLVAFIPGLLMLATFGLDRLEAGLDEGTVSQTDVAEILEQAKADSARMPFAPFDTGPLHTLPLREAQYDEIPLAEPTPGLPTRVYVRHRANPQFQQTRQADRV
jgi:hypothetical protein